MFDASEHPKPSSTSSPGITSRSRVSTGPGSESPLDTPGNILTVDPAIERELVDDVRSWRAVRDQQRVDTALAALRAAALDGSNLMVPSIELARAGGTTGEWSGALRDQAVRFVALGDRNFLSVNDDVAITFGNPAPRQSPRRQLAHRRAIGPRGPLRVEAFAVRLAEDRRAARRSERVSARRRSGRTTTRRAGSRTTESATR